MKPNPFGNYRQFKMGFWKGMAKVLNGRISSSRAIDDEVALEKYFKELNETDSFFNSGYAYGVLYQTEVDNEETYRETNKRI